MVPAEQNRAGLDSLLPLGHHVWTLCCCPWSPRFVQPLLNHTLGSLKSLQPMRHPGPCSSLLLSKSPVFHIQSFPTYFFQIDVPSWKVATGTCCRLFHLHAEHLALLHFNSPIPCLEGTRVTFPPAMYKLTLLT